MAHYRWRATFCTRGRRYPAVAISGPAVIFGLGPDAPKARTFHSRRGCLNGAPFKGAQ
jgi:hypothetical protein